MCSVRLGRSFLLLALLLAARSGRAGEAPAYPRELDGYRLSATASWGTLRPLVSTLADVRRLLGTPKEEVDLALSPGARYPGDARATQPLLIYAHDKDWDLYVYAVRSDLSTIDRFPVALRDHLGTLELLPRAPRSFAGIDLAARGFSSQRVHAADAGWLDWSDGSGLHYHVYEGKPGPRGRGGTLSRIVYGPSEAQLTALRREVGTKR